MYVGPTLGLEFFVTQKYVLEKIVLIIQKICVQKIKQY